METGEQGGGARWVGNPAVGGEEEEEEEEEGRKQRRRAESNRLDLAEITAFAILGC